MTDEEKAEEYLKDESKYLIEDVEGNIINITKNVKEAFLAGLEAGRPQWHDLRENPNDLPNDGELVLANNLLHTESVKFGKDKGFGISWKTDYFELSGVVFWKEIVLPELPKESE